MQVLLVNEEKATLPTGVNDLARELGWETTSANGYDAAYHVARDSDFDVILLPVDNCQDIQISDDLLPLWELIESRRAATIVIGENKACHVRCQAGNTQGVVDFLSRDATLDQISGRFAMIDRYQERFAQMQSELKRMEKLGKRLNEHFREVDQEMQLAARLQRDFLPQLSEPIENLQFSVIYRPATWVSGDIYDVFRIDEKHTGFYVADAVGHGVAASLLTMFIKRSIVAKRVNGSNYTVLSPTESMSALNDALADQGLPNCQFVTASYGIINHETLEYEYARGGHPYPILIGRDGRFQELKTSGGLLGLFQGEHFETGRIQLHQGDKVLIYTDGVELSFQHPKSTNLDTSAYFDNFKEAAQLPLQPMFDRLQHELDVEMGSLSPRDDVTLLGLEVK